MSNFFKKIKTAAKHAVGLGGYAVHKLPPKPQKSSTVVGLAVAGKTLKIHGGNPLRLVYQQNPEFNLLMTYAAMLVKAKYPTAWAVDVGANIGDTLAIIRRRANLPVICVEGDPHCYNLLEENARQFDPVHLFNVFLSSQPGSVFVETDKDGWNTTLSDAKPHPTGRRVDFETMDGLAAKLNCQTQVKLIKVDAEGYDLRILRGAAGTLASARPVVTFELNKDNIEPLGDDVSDFWDYLTKLGYDNFFLTDPDGHAICTLGGGDKKLFTSLYHFSGYGQAIHYLDVWAFHQNDGGLFDPFVTGQKDFVATFRKPLTGQKGLKAS